MELFEVSKRPDRYIIGEIPAGTKNGINLVFQTSKKYVPGTLQVFLSGLAMNGVQADPDRDFDCDIDNKTFTFRVDAALSHRLNRAPCQREPLTVNYKLKA